MLQLLLFELERIFLFIHLARLEDKPTYRSFVFVAKHFKRLTIYLEEVFNRDMRLSVYF